MAGEHPVKDILVAAGVVAAAFACGVLLHNMEVEEHIPTVFVFAVFLVSLLTEGYLYGLVTAVVSMLAVNYAFTYPYFALNFTIPVNLISAVVMITVAVLTCTLTAKVKIHESEKAESERERMRANLMRAVSHDLRTPLTTIYSASTMLRDKRQNLSPAQQDEMLRHIQEDSEWLVRMVENLLSVTRIDDGKVKLNKAPTVVDELVDSVMTKFRSLYPRQEVTVELPDEIVAVPMDTILIEQVLINLLENAVLHAEGMTQLTLRVSVLGRYAVFLVEDNGCGIREDRLERIFTGGGGDQDHAPDGRKRNFGIGLSVCATIIKAHGGEISAENLPGGGARFCFTLETEDVTYDEQ